MAGMKLRAWRRANNLTVREAADRLGVTFHTIYRYEQGKVVPPPDKMRQIIALSGGAVTPDDFFDVPAPAEAA